MISALAAALQVSEGELTGGPHLGADRLQAGPHTAIPALRAALAVNAIGQPVTDRARPLPEVIAELESLRPAYAAADYMRLGAPLPGQLKVGEGVCRGAQLHHDRRRLRAMAHHVTHDQRRPAAGQGDGVVPVPADHAVTDRQV
jgi:hypothetical protein